MRRQILVKAVALRDDAVDLGLGLCIVAAHARLVLDGTDRVRGNVLSHHREVFEHCAERNIDLLVLAVVIAVAHFVGYANHLVANAVQQQRRSHRLVAGIEKLLAFVAEDNDAALLRLIFGGQPAAGAHLDVTDRRIVGLHSQHGAARCFKIGDLLDVAAAQKRGHAPRRLRASCFRAIVPPFLKAFPDIRLEVIVEDGFIDILAAGCDAGIRYDERLEQDMIATPIGPRVQRFATAASPAYLDAHGRPAHPRELLGHACLRGRFASGLTPPWEFERDGEVLKVDPRRPVDGTAGRGGRPRGRRSHCRSGHRSPIRGLAKPPSDQWRARTGAGAVVAELSGTFSILSRPPLPFPAPLRAFVEFIKI